MNQEKSKEEQFLDRVVELAQEYDVEFLTFTKGPEQEVERDGQTYKAHQVMMGGNGGVELARAVHGGLQNLIERAEAGEQTKEAVRRFTNEN